MHNILENKVIVFYKKNNNRADQQNALSKK